MADPVAPYVNALNNPTPEDQAAMMPETYVNPIANALVRTPEYMARGVGKLIDTAAQTPYGLRREDVTDIPGSAQPIDPLVGEAVQTTTNLMGAGAPGAEAGAVGALGSKYAKTANLNKLEQAQKFERKGYPNEEIIDKTGWYRSPTDQEWRYIIPDDQMRVSKNIMNLEPGDTLTGPTTKMVHHPDYFKAFPQYETSQMSIANKPIPRGEFRQGHMIIEGPDPEAWRDVIAHEMGGHGSQYFSNLPMGANAPYMQKRMEEIARSGGFPEKEFADPNMQEVFKQAARQAYHVSSGETEARLMQRMLKASDLMKKTYGTAKPYSEMELPWKMQDVPYNKQLLIDRQSRIMTPPAVGPDASPMDIIIQMLRGQKY